MQEFCIDTIDKIKKCASCKHCHPYLNVKEDDFWYSVNCDKVCPDELCFDCVQCLLCDHFEECLRNDKADKIA